MRTIRYAIFDINKQERITHGMGYNKVHETLEAMLKENPNANLKIVHKWFSI